MSFISPFPVLGAVRSHLSDFKKHRAARIDHYVVEVNKLIIRLEKVNFVVLKHFLFCKYKFSGREKIRFLQCVLGMLYVLDAGRETPHLELT